MPLEPICAEVFRISFHGLGFHCGKVGLKSGSSLRPGQSASVGVPSFWKIRKIVSISLSPWNSAIPVAISPKMQPALHTSTGSEYISDPKSISGARYHVVTTSCVYFGIGSMNARAMPKSAIFTRPAPSMRMFCGLRSLCMILCEWQKSIPHMSCCCSARTAAGSRWRPCCFMYCFRLNSTNSKMRCSRPGVQYTSRSFTMFGWLAPFSTATSRMAVLGTPSSSCSVFTFFTATTRWVCTQRAL
mmetsp:Transcript_35838/g.100822  ORF Transcript_35838/g.100822 Transcript_35838/m.100822 type:complete len:244 (+) Transcript_35838:262-993(+)